VSAAIAADAAKEEDVRGDESETAVETDVPADCLSSCFASSLRRPKGVHAHIKMRADNSNIMPRFCFTGAKVLNKVKSEE
jgi:hypothetical protein